MRLTTKGLIDNTKTDDIPYLERYKKLSQLEDIEEELGIDLITLFKALKNGIYTKDNNLLTFPCLSIKGNVLVALPSFRTFNFKDYGKTWALTKEELK